MPWLDGLRAVSVLAVIGDHEYISFEKTAWVHRLARGGFVGVDVFFVISGFLITSLLLREREKTGRIDAPAFYLRRARRLFPALAVLLIAVLGGAVLFESNHEHQVLGAVVVTALYAANWVQAFGGVHLGALGHTWSLACEEQFYLLWPALLTVLAIVGVRGRWLVAVLTAGSVAAVVYVVVAVQSHWGFYRVYFALDTHCAGLLIGATLGAAWTLDLLPSGRIWTAVRRLSGVVGAVALLATIEAGVTLPRHLASTFAHLRIVTSYQCTGADYLIASFAAAAIIWALAAEAPTNPAARALGWAPLRGLGRISYGLYLYSAPITIWLTPSTTGIHSVPALMSLQVGLSIVLAWLSFETIERLFRVRRPASPPPDTLLAGDGARRQPPPKKADSSYQYASAASVGLRPGSTGSGGAGRSGSSPVVEC